MQASRSSKTAVRRQASPRVCGLLWAAVIFASLPAGMVMAVEGSELPPSQQAAATEVTPAASDARTAWEKVFVTLWRAFIMAWDGPDAQMTALAAAGTDQSFDAGADAADAGEPGDADSSSAEPPATDAGTPGVQDAASSEGGSRSSTALPVGGGAASSGGGGVTSAARSGGGGGSSSGSGLSLPAGGGGGGGSSSGGGAAAVRGGDSSSGGAYVVRGGQPQALSDASSGSGTDVAAGGATRGTGGTSNMPSVATNLFLARYGGSFPVFDGTLYKNKPDLTAFGLENLLIYYEGKVLEVNRPDLDLSNNGFGPTREIMDALVIQRDNGIWGPPSEPYTRRRAREAAEVSPIVVLDEEWWPWSRAPWRMDATEAQVNAALAEYERIARIYKSERPNLILGYFLIMPINPGLDAESYRLAKESSDRFKYSLKPDGTIDPNAGLADLVDVIFPSFYTRFERDYASWERRIMRRLTLAKGYGKPVVPFLFPRYHPEAPAAFAMKPIPADMWRQQLQFCYEHCDGVVIWSMDEPWDSSADWWRQTLAFLAEIRAKDQP